jgi:hypothetical protein
MALEKKLQEPNGKTIYTKRTDCLLHNIQINDKHGAKVQKNNGLSKL